MRLWSRGEKGKQMPCINEKLNDAVRATSIPNPCCIPHYANGRCSTQLSFMQPLIYFLVNTLRKQSLELDGNWLCFIKLGKEEISLLGNLLHSWRRKKMSDWDKGGFATPTSLLPAGKTDMKGLRIVQLFIFFWWNLSNSWSEIK